MRGVFVRDASIARFGKRNSMIEMLEECTSGINARPDLIIFGSMSFSATEMQQNTASAVSQCIGFPRVKCLCFDTSSSTGAALVHYGSQLIATGRYREILVIAADRLSAFDTQHANGLFASVLPRHEREAGCTMPSIAALLWNMYAERYHANQDALMHVAIKNHRNGYRNPAAHIRKIISETDYLSSRLVSTPLRVLDCAPVSDGAAAALLANQGSVRIAGIGHACDTLGITSRLSDPFRAVREAAQEAYSMCSVKPSDIDFAELHDAFTPFEIMETEACGFFEVGKGAEAVLQGATDENGEIPVNLSGGLKSRGHPVSVSGLAQIVEIFKLLNDESKRKALAVSIGGAASNNFVTVLET